LPAPHSRGRGKPLSGFSYFLEKKSYYQRPERDHTYKKFQGENAFSPGKKKKKTPEERGGKLPEAIGGKKNGKNNLKKKKRQKKLASAMWGQSLWGEKPVLSVCGAKKGW